MWRNLAFDVAVGATLAVAWYWLCLHLNRRRSARILRWLDEALSGHGHIAGIEWISASRFQIRLRLTDACFRQPSLMVRLNPREIPLYWITAFFKKPSETVTFEANLPTAPGFDLDVGNQRCGVRTRRFMPQKGSGEWSVEHLGPFLISSRREWQRDTVNALDSLMTTRSRDRLKAPILWVRYRRTSPHFSATAPLQALEPEPNSSQSLFSVLRELATGASASRF
jgi:hypothetical protein